MLCRTGCAGLAAFSALIAMSTLAASDSSALRPIGVCVDKPGTGTFVGAAGWTSCNDADGTARSKARGFAEGFARSGCSASLTVAQGTTVCAARGAILIKTTPYLSNTDNYAISIKASLGFCSQLRTVQCTRLIQLRRNAALSRRRGGVAPGLAIGLSKRQPLRIKQHAVMCARTSVRLDHRSGCQFVANGDRRP